MLVKIENIMSKGESQKYMNRLLADAYRDINILNETIDGMKEQLKSLEIEVFKLKEKK